MDIFYDFVKKNYEGYSLVNFSKKLNSRNISVIGNHINNNLDTIFLIKKNTTNFKIFHKLSYPKHMYLFLNGEKVFALEDTNIEPHIKKFDDFLGYKRIKESDKKEDDKKEDDKKEDDKNEIIKPDENMDREATKEECDEVINRLEELSKNIGKNMAELKDKIPTLNSDITETNDEDEEDEKDEKDEAINLSGV